MILLSLPFFLPLINSRCSLASSSWKRISVWKAWRNQEEKNSVRTIERKIKQVIINLYNIEFQNRRDSRTNFTLKAMHLKHTTLANDLRTASATNSTQDASHRRGVDPIRTRDQHIVMERQKPDAREVELRREE